MRLVILLFMVLVAADMAMARGKPRTVMPALSKAKDFIMSSMPAKLQKTLIGTAAVGLLLGMPIAQAERGSDTALQQVEQSSKGKTSLRTKLQTLFSAQHELYDVLLKLRAMKTYDPDFAATVAEGKTKMELMIQAEQSIVGNFLGGDRWAEVWQDLVGNSVNDNVNVDLWDRLYYPTLQLRDEFRHLTKGIEGQEREVIAWTVWQSDLERLVGIDYLDVEHYRAVKDILTAADYDGVSVHYFVDGESRRGVAKAVHPQLPTRVRIDTDVIDITQISGVLITRRPIYDVVEEQQRPLLAIARPRYLDLRTEQVVARQDMLSYLPHPDDYEYAGRWYEQEYSAAQEQAGANIVWWGQVRKHRRSAEFYSDDYGELTIYAADVGRELVLTFSGEWDSFLAFAHLGGAAAPTQRGNIIWVHHITEGASAIVFGNGVGFDGIPPTQESLRVYQAARDTLTASDYEKVLVRYREGERIESAQVIEAHEGSATEAKVVDFNRSAKIINVRDIQGVLIVDHSDYGKAVTFTRGDTTYHGEAFLVFSTDELSVLVYAKRQGKGELELVDEPHVITVHRRDVVTID